MITLTEFDYEPGEPMECM